VGKGALPRALPTRPLAGTLGFADCMPRSTQSALAFARGRAARRLRAAEPGTQRMSIDTATVRHIARLARIAVTDDEVEHLKGEINDVLTFVEQLSQVDIAGVEPMTSVTPMAIKQRPDVVNDGEIADDIVRNAPAAQGHFFLVPKVVE
jgi:aspartyl-tRNA(Asn)/glutamyl-tRNA(Gln) amidotransferase subunit C